MCGMESDTIGGFNSMIEKQKKEDGEAFTSTVLFDHECEVIHDRVDLQKINKMADKDYYVRGCTGTQLNYEVISDAVCAVRACRPLQTDWKDRIENDYRNRK